MEISQATHGVENQAPPLVPYNVFEADVALREAIEREGGGWGVDRLREIGELAGSAEAVAHSERAERNEPVLRTHDRYGNRIDEVELDPSWHWCLRQAIEREIHCLPWRDPQPGAHAVRAALFFVWSQVNSGVMCPVSMTYSAVPALREEPELAAEWEPRVTKPSYDDGALVGMAMTEKQGGSDVRANSTRATPNGDAWEITGHKWFCSYPPCDLFLTLAQAPAGLSCFLIEGRDPGFRIQRLKDKLGTRSLPSSELELHGVRGRLVGEEGRGVRTIIRMVNHTRLDCLIGSSAGMRWGLAQAVHHARHRSAFGALLADQPLMRNVLADLAIESEAATAVTMRVARAYDEGDAPFRRIATAVMKHWVCKRATGHAGEALECLGGNGYVEESGMPRLLRDSPLNSIWEGSGNVSALDVLRALAKEPEALPALLAECELARGGNAALDAHLDRIRETRPQDPEFEARRVVSDLAIALQASLLVRNGPVAVADAFCASRLDGGGRAYGMLPPSVDAEAIVDRALPRLNTLRYEVTGRIARITLDRPERANAITLAMPRELAECVEEANLDPAVHVIALAGSGNGFCGGYDLVEYAETQMPGHDPSEPWDPVADWQMMSRNLRGFMSLFHSDKPVACKVHGYCVAGGTDMALCSDLLVIADDARIGYPPARVWGVPTSALWAFRVGDQRAKRLLFTGDLIDGRTAHDWGLAVEAPPAAGLDERFEELVERVARTPVNQLVMMKLLVNQALFAQGLHATQALGVFFDGIARHTPEGYAFQKRAAEAGFKQAVRERDDPYDAPQSPG